jgi:hypothetical protein
MELKKNKIRMENKNRKIKNKKIKINFFLFRSLNWIVGDLNPG